MKALFAMLMLLTCTSVLALPCDCEVKVYSPMTGSHQLSHTVLAKYELEEFSTFSQKNQAECRKLCLDQFEEDMPENRLTALLLTYSQRLINEKVLGYNCTGLTTLKYPIRVHAKLGPMGLGNVADIIHVVNHEEACF